MKLRLAKRQRRSPVPSRPPGRGCCRPPCAPGGWPRPAAHWRRAIRRALVHPLLQVLLVGSIWASIVRRSVMSVNDTTTARTRCPSASNTGWALMLNHRVWPPGPRVWRLTSCSGRPVASTRPSGSRQRADEPHDQKRAPDQKIALDLPGANAHSGASTSVCSGLPKATTSTPATTIRAPPATVVAAGASPSNNSA